MRAHSMPVPARHPPNNRFLLYSAEHTSSVVRSFGVCVFFACGSDVFHIFGGGIFRARARRSRMSVSLLFVRWTAPEQTSKCAHVCLVQTRTHSLISMTIIILYTARTPIDGSYRYHKNTCALIQARFDLRCQPKNQYWNCMTKLSVQFGVRHTCSPHSQQIAEHATC